MIGLYNRDSSFFEVTVDGIPTPTNITANIISFTYEEERGKMNSGSISMLDPQLVYSNLLKQGKSLTMSWGYKQRPIFLSAPLDTTEMWGEYRRKNVKAITQFPSGSATENGVVTFNCNFISSEFMRGQKNKVFKYGTKKDVIFLILQDMGFSPENIFVGFPRQNEKITSDTYVMQNNSNFKFLCQLAYEWHADFRTAHSRNGGKIALFAGKGYPNLMDTFASMAAQAISGQSITLDYGYQTGLNTTMVRNYSYEQAGGGSGDNIQIVLGADGTPQFRRYITKNEKTLVYKFHPEKMEAALKKITDISQKGIKVKEWMDIENFDDVMTRPDTKGFFTLEVDSTAPQGVGFTVKCKTLGNPMLTVPVRVNFGKVDKLTRESSKSSLGWPDMLTTRDLGFRIRKVTHTITTAGYECDLDIADAFTISGGALI